MKIFFVRKKIVLYKKKRLKLCNFIETSRYLYIIYFNNLGHTVFLDCDTIQPNCLLTTKSNLIQPNTLNIYVLKI